MPLNLKILLFHRVSPERDPLWNPITPKLFNQILSFLSKNYEIVPVEKTLLGEYKPAGKKPLCGITFDDGYKDFVDYAFPILRKYRLPSSLYVITHCADEGLPPWTYIVNHVFINTSHLSLDLSSKALSPALRKTRWKNAAERIAYARKLSPFLKQLNNQERQLIYEQILFDFNDTDLPQGMMMNWSEIREVSQNNCEVGSHSQTHPLLTKRINADRLQLEIEGSGKTIEKQIGKFPLAFSYPFGNYNSVIEKMTAEAGYKLGIAVNNQSYSSSLNTLYEVPRIELYDEPFLKSRLRLSGFIPKFNKVLKGQ